MKGVGGRSGEQRTERIDTLASASKLWRDETHDEKLNEATRRPERQGENQTHTHGFRHRCLAYRAAKFGDVEVRRRPQKEGVQVEHERDASTREDGRIHVVSLGQIAICVGVC